MKRVLGTVVMLALLVAARAYADDPAPKPQPTREFTEEEQAAVDAYLAQRNAELAERNWAIGQLKIFRSPGSLTREYERYKYDKAKQRWKARPKFLGWQDKCYRWYPKGKWYSCQLTCAKCKGHSFRPGAPPCNGWINPSGVSCRWHQASPFMEQWQFAVALIATDHKKPMEAKAHLWNAFQHDEMTAAEFDELMGRLDQIVAADVAKKVEAAKKWLESRRPNAKEVKRRKQVTQKQDKERKKRIEAERKRIKQLRAARVEREKKAREKARREKAARDRARAVAKKRQAEEQERRLVIWLICRQQYLDWLALQPRRDIVIHQVPYSPPATFHLDRYMENQRRINNDAAQRRFERELLRCLRGW